MNININDMHYGSSINFSNLCSLGPDDFLALWLKRMFLTLSGLYPYLGECVSLCMAFMFNFICAGCQFLVKFFCFVLFLSIANNCLF